MWLLNCLTRKLEYWGDDRAVPSNSILSHRWEEDQVTFKDWSEDNYHTKKGVRKMLFCCEQALLDDMLYAWVDTCCI